jgi:hypothetical protein
VRASHRARFASDVRNARQLARVFPAEFPAEAETSHLQTEAAICPSGSSVTGVQVMRGRNDRLDQDFFNFKLRVRDAGSRPLPACAALRRELLRVRARSQCGKQWAEQPLGLAFDGLRETRSATCPAGASIAGLRVHRGFQDWGDADTYEFQLYCTSPSPTGRSGGAAPRNGGTGGAGATAAADADGRARAPSRSRKQRGGASGADSTSDAQPQRQPPRQPASSGRSSAFGSRAAEADAAAAEVRAELARARAMEANKDEL